MAESQYTWVPFFKELSLKLLEYKTNRNDLLRIFYGLGEKLTHAYKENGEILTDINPFDILGTLAVGRIERRTQFAKYYKEVFSLNTAVPLDYEGIPSLNPQKVMFIWGQKEPYTELFWHLFEAITENKDISELFNKALTVKGVRRNLTMGLFWMNPIKYLSLDRTNEKYLLQYGFDKIPDVKHFDYEDYSRLMDDVSTQMLQGVIKEKTFLDFSAAAYVNTRNKHGKVEAVNESGIRTWMYSPGENASMWKENVDKREMCIGSNKLGDLRLFKSKQEMANKIAETYDSKGSNKNRALACWEFVHVMKEGDIIFAKKGRNTIVGRGVVTSDYSYDGNRERFKNIRTVKWTDVGNWVTEDSHAMKTLTDITRYSDYVKMLNDTIESKSVNNVENEESVNYWWLCGKPSIWNMSDWEVGDEQEYTLYNERGNKRRIFQNFLDARAGDLVLCYEATPSKQITCIAEITKGNDGKVLKFKKIETLANPITYNEVKDNPDLSGLEFFVNPNGSFFKLTKDEFEVLMDMIRESNPISTQVINEKYSKKEFLEEVYMSSADYDRLSMLLKNKKNIILQGAPGVGKTFCAKRLAYSMMGEKDRSRIGVIQFHQNYSYEDFILGYKPAETSSGFELKRGVFYKFCKKAENDPKRDYFFIIDEINRGNLSKIFGELLMLVENKYRGKEHKLTLAYSEEEFFVPENVYIIGMMNTADRSLAIIDYALRRRFSFFEMKPGYQTNGFRKYQKKLDNLLFNKLVSEVEKLNEKIAVDDSLGHGFEIGHSYFCDFKDVSKDYLKQIVDYDIIPMLREYWFDNLDEVKKWEKEFEDILNDK